MLSSVSLCFHWSTMSTRSRNTEDIGEGRSCSQIRRQEARWRKIVLIRVLISSVQHAPSISLKTLVRTLIEATIVSHEQSYRYFCPFGLLCFYGHNSNYASCANCSHDQLAKNLQMASILQIRQRLENHKDYIQGPTMVPLLANGHARKFLYLQTGLN